MYIVTAVKSGSRWPLIVRRLGVASQRRNVTDCATALSLNEADHGSDKCCGITAVHKILGSLNYDFPSEYSSVLKEQHLGSASPTHNWTAVPTDQRNIRLI